MWPDGVGDNLALIAIAGRSRNTLHICSDIIIQQENIAIVHACKQVMQTC